MQNLLFEVSSLRKTESMQYQTKCTQIFKATVQSWLCSLNVIIFFIYSIFFLLFYSNIDRKDSGLLTQQQFRAAIEGRFELNMSEQEFESFLKKVPIDSDGMVKYVEFMSKFDTL